MDTGLRDSRPHVVLNRSVIPDGRVPALPIIEHLDVFKELLLGFVSGGVVPMIDQLTLERSEETLDAGVVPAVAVTAHAGDEAIPCE